MITVARELLWNVLHFFETYNGAITALATMAMGFFSFVLVVVTRRQAILTKQSVRISERALTDLERPYIYFKRIETDIRGFFRPHLSWDPEKTWPEFTLVVVNYGRTPGNIDTAAIWVDFTEGMPPETPVEALTAEHPDASAAAMIVGPTNEFAFPRMRPRQNLTVKIRDGLRQGTVRLYCHGLFVYRDIFNNSHTTKFCCRYNPRRDEWAPEGSSERNRAD